MKILFLVGIDFQGPTRYVNNSYCIRLWYFLSEQVVFKRVPGHFSVRQIFVLSIFSAVIFAPLIFGVLFWVLISLSLIQLYHIKIILNNEETLDELSGASWLRAVVELITCNAFRILQ